jgi:hypothetical protein
MHEIKKSGPDSLGIIIDSDFVYISPLPPNPNGVGAIPHGFESTE